MGWEKEAKELNPSETSKIRAPAGRANFLAGDRPDIAFAVNELCREMAAPITKDADALKRFARYVLGRPRMVVHFGWQAAPASLDVFTDSDWPGCVKTRRFTTGGVLMRGGHHSRVGARVSPLLRFPVLRLSS